MPLSTKPHGGRGKRIEPDIGMECEDCGRKIPVSANPVCQACDYRRDIEWDEYFIEMDGERDEFPEYDED